MNPCVLILFTFSTILLVTSASKVSQQKRLQTESSSSNKKSKNDKSSAGKKVIVDNDEKVYVAVIGGGINAGLFTHYLHELINAEVHIFDHGMSEQIENSSFVVHENQKYIMEIVSKLKLDLKDLNQAVVMYDGQKNPLLIFHENDPIKSFTELFIKQLVLKFETIYNIQNKQQGFMNLSTLLHSMYTPFPKFLKMSTKEFILERTWRASAIVLKVVHSLLLNYGQNLESNAFAGLTSFMFSGLLGKLKQITNPVKQVVSALLGESDKFLNLNVSKVTYEEIYYKFFRPRVSWIENGEEHGLLYDYVVVATPEIDNIDFLKFKKPIAVCKNRKMVFTTVKASLKKDVFEKSDLVTAITNVQDSNNSFRLATKTSNSEWNILADVDSSVSSEIQSIFNFTGSAKAEKTMLLPDYSNKDCAVKATFVLHTKLFYLNAIEWASTLLEMKAIGARNVALKIKNCRDQLTGINSSRKE